MNFPIDNCATWIKTTFSNVKLIDQVRYDLYLATIIMIVIALTQVLARLIKKEVIPIEEWISTITLILLGSMTLFLRNDYFIKLKPTIVYMSLAISQVNRYPLNNAWTVSWFLLAFSNLIVAYTATTNTWAYFQLFGVVGLTILFIIGQVIYFYFKKNQTSHEFPHR